MIISILIAGVTSCLTAYIFWYIDQQKLQCQTIIRAISAVALMLISIWVIVLILSSIWFKIPGAYGPVQFWPDNAQAEAFMRGPRVWTMFLMIGASGLAIFTILSTIISLFLSSMNNRWLRLIAPIAALSSFALAYSLIIHYDFLPRA